ncbi:MAG: GlmU family protein [bacterium]
MVKAVCIFEDKEASQLTPLSLTRPVYDLRCGFTTLKEKIVRQFPLSTISLHCRDYLQEVVREQNPGVEVNEIDADECLFINGRILVDSDFVNKLDAERERLYVDRGTVVAALLRGPTLRNLTLDNPLPFDRLLHSIETSTVETKLIAYPWHLVHNNAAEICHDFATLDKGGERHGKIYTGAVLLNEEQIFLGTNSTIKPGVVLDAESGPIYVGNSVAIMSNAVIQGPAFIGDNSLIKAGAKIYAGTSIGEVCKVGGEVEESIIHSYANKQHDGFLGHAYLGQWVNIGADTNNSDLKNNYGSVRVYINGDMVDSGSTFVGLFLGDHSKTGINTMVNTGTVVGVMSNLFGSDFPPKFIPSFSWGGKDRLVEHNLERALATAARVMLRRNVEISTAYEALFRHLFELTAQERGDVLAG